MTDTTEQRGAKATVACGVCGRLNRVELSRTRQGPKCGQCGAPIALDHPHPATDANLERILRDAEVPVLVDFYADWCGPCKMIAPILEEIARSRAGQALILKLDTDRNPASAARYGIGGIPTLIRFDRGTETRRQVGAVPRQTLEAML